MIQPASGLDEPVEDLPHNRALSDIKSRMERDYRRLQEQARQHDPQRAGHGAEVAWASLLENWLPADYSVRVRRYIVPEVGQDVFETDIVVLHPGYPRPLRDEEEVLAAGVAAAFNVKLTADSEGLADSIERTQRLRSGLNVRTDSALGHLKGPFPIGLLAHSHGWSRPASKPVRNVTAALEASIDEADHPRLVLDYACIADLGFWATSMWPRAAVQMLNNFQLDVPVGSPMMMLMLARQANPVAAFLLALYQRLAFSDQRLSPVADAFSWMRQEREYEIRAHKAWPFETAYDKLARHVMEDGASRQWTGFIW